MCVQVEVVQGLSVCRWRLCRASVCVGGGCAGPQCVYR